MVSKSLFPLFAASFVLSTFTLSCGGSAGGDEFAEHVVGGSQPVLVSADPAEAPVGATITIKGTGFSIIPAENVVSAGGASAVAETFAIADGGNEEITFDVPAGASEGESPLLVIVQGHTSNALTLTITP